jgi:kynureninase
VTDLVQRTGEEGARARDEADELATCRDGLTLNEDDIVEAMTDRVALVVLPSVLYASGQLLDMPRLTSAAHRRGALIGFDCSHSIGTIPHSLDAWGVDFAFWCSYKYLNSGPGAIGGLYLNRRHGDKAPGLAGWFGNRRATQFDMSPEFDPAPDATRLHIGTPDVLSLGALEGSLEVVLAAGIDRVRRKSLALTAYLMEQADAQLAELGVRVVNPREAGKRGGHVALAHPEATRICKALKAARVVPDFRPPNIVRLAPVALYNTFLDCYRAVEIMKRILQTGEHLNHPPGRGLVA